MELHRIFVTGGAGSGKSTLAARIAREAYLPLYDLDGIGLAKVATMPEPVDHTRVCELLEEDAKELAAAPRWVCDGSFIGWTEPFRERAELIVWLHVPWRVASYRIVMRHIRAELRRNNRFPGWRRLGRFWRWYSNGNPYGLNEWGTPRTFATLEQALQPYTSKVVRCERVDDVLGILRAGRQSEGA